MDNGGGFGFAGDDDDDDFGFDGGAFDNGADDDDFDDDAGVGNTGMASVDDAYNMHNDNDGELQSVLQVFAGKAIVAFVSHN